MPAKQEKPRNGTSLGVKHFMSAEEKQRKMMQQPECALKLLLP